ncbi:dynein-related subfamily AAA family protein [Archangium gephyra]|uniref:Dynein-related subfamily AAA family protein n=1 Tax=Archangium gephyra TaxID=48 RepID=A0AAC8TAN5_9BACT|nr:MoxR family ATPase [Archangium gephyra]AKI98916.1 MoxR-like ATPase [Archangium gephyra]REG30829.1 dynein-related subfamily AAA family protein [Archangium gephyra]
MSKRSEPKPWWVYRGNGQPHEDIGKLPPPPPWRKSRGPALERPLTSGNGPPPRFEASDEVIELVNTALYLRRPLLVTGKPGSGKSSLAEAVAWELKLGRPLRWPINTRSTLQEGLYRYDAIGRLQEASLQEKRGRAEGAVAADPDIQQFLQLGPLGTALAPSKYPRVLLIDEIDKSDIDLPNDLLNVFEEGEFEVPELSRLVRTGADDERKVRTLDGEWAPTDEGWVRCHAFPLVIMTSNGEREFPPAFLRRCLQLDLKEPGQEQLEAIIRIHLGDEAVAKASPYLRAFLERRSKDTLATDQLLNAIYLVTRVPGAQHDMQSLVEVLFKSLGSLGTP